MKPYSNEVSQNIGSKRGSASRYSEQESDEDGEWLYEFK
jgi:hypothetical protein